MGPPLSMLIEVKDDHLDTGPTGPWWSVDHKPYEHASMLEVRKEPKI